MQNNDENHQNVSVGTILTQLLTSCFTEKTFPKLSIIQEVRGAYHIFAF